MAAIFSPAVDIHFETYGFTLMSAKWGFRARQVPEHLVYTVTNGFLVADISGRSWLLGPGGFCLLPPHVVHTFANADAEHPVTLQYFRLELRDRGEVLHLDHPPVVVEHLPSVRVYFDRMHDDKESPLDDAQLRIRAELLLAFSEALRAAQMLASKGGSLTYAQRERIYDLVRQKPDVRLRPSDLALQVGISPQYFTRLFQRSFGTSPRRWLVEQRVEGAATLLAESTLTVSEIAARLGYGDVYQFSRQFKQIVGLSPMHYRRQPPSAPE